MKISIRKCTKTKILIEETESENIQYVVSRPMERL